MRILLATVLGRTAAIALASLLVVGCSSNTTPMDSSNPDVRASETGSDATDSSAPMDVMDAAVDAPADTGPTDAGCHPGYDVYDPYCDPDAQSPSTAITAPSETWTWIPFSDAICANGSATGIAVNLTNRSNHVLIYLEGGGACWDATTCYVISAAAHVDGYDQSTFNSELPAVQAAPFFSRTSATNPWRDASYVYIPYCSADVHAGDNFRYFTSGGTAHPTYFEGYRNISVFLRRLVPTFASADHVWLSGSSAGGFGAALNWEHVQNAFGSTRVDLVDDSGPPIPTSRFAQWYDAWHIQFPAGCTSCSTDFTALMPYYGRTIAAGHRAALLSYTMDMTISFYFGISQAQFQTELTTAATNDLDPISTWKYFFVSGTTHTLLPTMDSVTGADGTPLTTWLNQMVSDDPAWASDHP